MRDRLGGKSVRHYLSSILDGIEWKVVISAIGAAVAAIGDFYTPYLWGFLTLYVLDFFSGILKSKHKGIPISSRRMRDSVTKLAAYMVLITSIIIASSYQEDLAFMVPGLYVYFMVTELKSIKENVEEMGIKLPLFASKAIDRKLEEEDEEHHNRR